MGGGLGIPPPPPPPPPSQEILQQQLNNIEENYTTIRCFCSLNISKTSLAAHELSRRGQSLDRRLRIFIIILRKDRRGEEEGEGEGRPKYVVCQIHAASSSMDCGFVVSSSLGFSVFADTNCMVNLCLTKLILAALHQPHAPSLHY